MSNIKDTDNWFHDKLYDHQAEVDQDAWVDMDIKLTRNNFLRFGFYHFNIYYVAVFLLSLLLSGAVAVDYFIISPNATTFKTKMKSDTTTQQTINNHSMDNNKIIISPQIKEVADTSKANLNRMLKNEIFDNNHKKTTKNRKTDKNDTINNLKNNINSNKSTLDTLNERGRIKEPNDTIPTKNSDSIKVIKKTIYLKKKDVIIHDTVIKYKKRP